MTRPPEALDAWIGDLALTKAADAVAPVVVDVPAERWVEAVASARDVLGLTWFDAITVVDEADGTFSVLVHLASTTTPIASLLLRTRTAGSPPQLDSLSGLFAGAAWHERESAEMFGIAFAGATDERRLLLPEAFDGAPLRKDFALATRAARPWPGAKEPGESDEDVAGRGADGVGGGRRRRRRAVPPGVPARDDDGRWSS